ncbi:hypothetical protein, partial [Sinomonas albida]|uniref:hypothetical protein n=1 Tax=Sinomonas albida TaxID=369942 RepID=UPI001B3C7C0F
MMQVNGVGAFVRALLPVRLSGGYSVTSGVWVAIDPSELQSVFEVWWKPEYVQLRLNGYLANEVMPEPPRRVRRLRSLGRMESCQGIRRRGTRPSCVSGRCGWSVRS